MTPQLAILLILGGALVLFILERWRYDLTALLALLAATILGLVPAEEAFTGFGHPAVITVAAVLVVSRGLADSGLIDRLAATLEKRSSSPMTLLAGLTTMAVVCSAFVNNVGALALLMPVALRLAERHSMPVSQLLMPLAFGSLLGGMTTLIGTPPNIIISAFRGTATGEPYGLFSFSPVGVGVALCGLVFLIVASHRLLPVRKGQQDTGDLFRIDEYTTELLVPQDSEFIGRPLERLRAMTDRDVVVAVVARGKRTVYAPDRSFILQAGDRLVVEVAPDDLEAVLEATDLRLEAEPQLVEGGVDEESLKLFEAVVVPRSRLDGESPESLQLRANHGLNVLAVARQGHRLRRRLKDVRFEPGDVLLVQAEAEVDAGMLQHLGLLGLRPRDPLRRRDRRTLGLAVGIFAFAVAALVLRLQPAPVVFVAAAVAMVMTRVVSLRTAYRAIDWPILILLGAMLPVGTAFETSGAAELLSGGLATLSEIAPPWILVAVVLVLAMVLSDIMNNAATAVILAPVAMGLADAMGVSPDPMLMAVAVGASCAFLTPIGHQSNTLVMGPGGYRFSDYWKLGLPLEVLIVVVGTPLILWAWPLSAG